MNRKQSQYMWVDHIPSNTRTAVFGFIREAHHSLQSNDGAFKNMPSLVSCLCIDYFYDRETFCVQSSADNVHVLLEPSRTKAVIDGGATIGNMRELFGSIRTDPCFRGLYRWKMRLICDQPDVWVFADFAIYTEFEHPINGRPVQLAYGAETSQWSDDEPLEMICEIELDTDKKDFRLIVDGHLEDIMSENEDGDENENEERDDNDSHHQWISVRYVNQEDYEKYEKPNKLFADKSWHIDAQKTYCVRVRMQCKGSVEVLEFERTGRE